MYYWRFVAADEPISYARDVVPFLEEHCIACHDDGFETSELALHDVKAMLKGAILDEGSPISELFT